KTVATTLAEAKAQEAFILKVKEAEAAKEAARQKAEEMNIDAQAHRDASEKEAQARKIIADAKAKEEATVGLAEAQVMHAKADAMERQGLVEATLIEKKAHAEAAGISAKADALKAEGLTEAEVIKQKALAEAIGIQEKAEAMKKLDGVGKEHEEFKLRLNKELQVELAEISIQKEIADAQAQVLSEALKAAHIDIVGGETMFFDKIVGQVTRAKGFDRLINHSDNLTDVKQAILGDGSGQGGNLLDRVKDFADRYGIDSETIRNLTVSSLLMELQQKVSSQKDKGLLSEIADMVKQLGLGSKKLG
nr:hypothetical protein [Chitinophagaceae bacterium]